MLFLPHLIPVSSFFYGFCDVFLWLCRVSCSFQTIYYPELWNHCGVFVVNSCHSYIFRLAFHSLRTNWIKYSKSTASLFSLWHPFCSSEKCSLHSSEEYFSPVFDVRVCHLIGWHVIGLYLLGMVRLGVSFWIRIFFLSFIWVYLIVLGIYSVKSQSPVDFWNQNICLPS